MKGGILITGNTKKMIDEVVEILDAVYIVSAYMLQSQEFSAYINKEKPGILIICLEDITMKNLTGIAELRRQQYLSGTKFITIGKKEEGLFFETVVPGSNPIQLNYPIDAQELKVTVTEELKNIEQEVIQAQKSILIVDDDPRILFNLRNILKTTYQVNIVTSGTDAINFLRTHPVDGILLDYKMPMMDGAKTFQAIREMGAGAGVPIIFLTAVSDKKTVVECLKLRPQGYLVKPISREELEEKLKEVLQ
ncbi:MAG: response regulator [Lachnospiraceae bacterium]